MLTADKVTELFCMADDFSKFFDKMTAKYTLKRENKRPYHRIQLITKQKSNMKGALMSVSDKLLLRKRAIIETVNGELKNIAQVEHSRHRCFEKYIVNMLGAIAAYCMFPKKPCINVQRTLDTQLTLF